jgi:threonine synthase
MEQGKMSAIYDLQSAIYNLRCVECGATYSGGELRYRCECGEVLEVQRDELPALSAADVDARWGSRQFPYQSGVWRYRELILPVADQYIVSKLEGNTNLYAVGSAVADGQRRVGQYTGVAQMWLKHEGENPTGSFKDRGMTAGVSQARAIGATAVACASTGNTSASLAAYAAKAGLRCFVFIPAGKIAPGKLAQALAYGAITLQVAGDFDAAMTLVQQVANELGIYLLNSINPFRIEGQKAIAFELMQQLNWQAPDWIVLPAGNLGNTAAIGKACQEMLRLGWVERLPRIAAIQAADAAPFYASYSEDFATRHTVSAKTIATAIQIGNPVSYVRAREVIRCHNGIVASVSDADILAAKAVIDAAGIGCEPASAASVAGTRLLRQQGVIKEGESIAAILTGHLLKDADTTIAYHLEGDNPGANRPMQVEADIKSVAREIGRYL